MLQRQPDPAQGQKGCFGGSPNRGSNSTHRRPCRSLSLQPQLIPSTPSPQPWDLPTPTLSLGTQNRNTSSHPLPSQWLLPSVPAHIQAPNYAAGSHVDDSRHVPCLGREHRALAVLTPPHPKPDTWGNSSDQLKHSRTTAHPRAFAPSIKRGICQLRNCSLNTPTAPGQHPAPPLAGSGQQDWAQLKLCPTATGCA